MLHQILLFTAVTTLAFASGLMLYTGVACHWARWKFKRALKGIRLLDDLRTLGNGAVSWALRKNLAIEVMERIPHYPNKTAGLLYGTKPCALTVDLDIIKRMLDDPNKNINRTDTLHLPMPEFEHSIMLAQDEKWRRLRRSFAPAIKGSRLKSANVLCEIDAANQKLIGLIDAMLADEKKVSPDGGRLVNIDDLAHRYALNLVFSCLYKQPDLVNFDERPCHWTRVVDDGYKALQWSPFVHASIVFPILKPVITWLIYHFHSQGVWRRELLQFIKRQARIGLEARKELQELQAAAIEVDPNNFTLKDGTKFSRNMIDYVIDHFLDGKLSKDEFLDNSFFLLNAADKTSAEGISHAFYQLALSPEIQERLRRSVQEHGAESEYLGWVINESLRLRPPVAIGCSRTLSEDIEFKTGAVLPKGTFVITPAYVIHRMTEYWGEDAHEFRPERWRDTSQHHPMQFMPFGYGPRGCPGKEFALFEMRSLLAAMVSRYKFEAEYRKELEEFDSPLFFTILTNAPALVTIKKLEADASQVTTG